MAPFETTAQSVASRDGASISYHQMGNGPGLVILHGGLESWRSHIELAEALSTTFTVYLPDRRGRGLSSPQDATFSMQTELDDLEALLNQTKAHFIMGVSSGALISLQASLRLPIRRAAIFEPPLLVDLSFLESSLKQFDTDIAQGNLAGALMTTMRLTEMGPAFFRAMPRWLFTPLGNWAISKREENIKKRGGKDSDHPSLPELTPTIRYDWLLVKEMGGESALESFRAIKNKQVLLLSGTASRPYLLHSVEELKKVIPNAVHVTLPGLDHLGTGNKDTGGKPELTANELRKFFLADLD